MHEEGNKRNVQLNPDETKCVFLYYLQDFLMAHIETRLIPWKCYLYEVLKAQNSKLVSGFKETL